jgi:hypothetical protein
MWENLIKHKETLCHELNLTLDQYAESFTPRERAKRLIYQTVFTSQLRMLVIRTGTQTNGYRAPVLSYSDEWINQLCLLFH